MYDYWRLKIHLIDIRESMCKHWESAFNEAKAVGYHENVFIHNCDFATFMSAHPEVDGIVSPANSYGLMDGGYDKAISDWFGEKAVDAVQEAIMKNYFGEQPVGSSLAVCIAGSGQYILHTPTMRVPSIIEDPELVYHCTRSCIIEALKTELDSIVIPAFGGCCGKVQDAVIADYMERALYSFENLPGELNWAWAYKYSSLGEFDPKRKDNSDS